MCIISPIFCRTIDILVETSVSLVLLSVLLLMCRTRTLCVDPTFSSAIDTVGTTSASLVDLKCGGFSC